jgi:peroxiredoxin
VTVDVLIEVLRLLLAALFALAGAAKLADPKGAARAARDFGAPERLALPLSISLSVLEVTIAGALLATGTARAAAAVAAALLVVLAAAVALARLRGRTPDCHCFGRLHSAPAGASVVVRNAALAGAALVVASRPSTSVGLTAAAIFAGAAAIGGQATLWLLLLRRYGAVLRRMEALERRPFEEDAALAPGDAIPPLTLVTASGDDVQLTDLVEGERPLLLVFTDSRCGACTTLYPSIARWQADRADALAIAVIGNGDHEELRALADEHGLEQVLLADRAHFSSLGVDGTPSAIVVSSQGRIASALRYGAEEIALLVDFAGGLRPGALAVGRG